MPHLQVLAKLAVGTILKAMYLRKAFEKKKKEPNRRFFVMICDFLFLCMGLVFVFADFSNFLLFFFAANPRVDFCNSAWFPWESPRGNPRGMARRRSSPRSSMESRRRRCVPKGWTFSQKVLWEMKCLGCVRKLVMKWLGSMGYQSQYTPGISSL